ncbi:MAG: hypothetical protein ACYC5M_14760 [Anaerolineae bacterium]
MPNKRAIAQRKQREDVQRVIMEETGADMFAPETVALANELLRCAWHLDKCNEAACNLEMDAAMQQHHDARVVRYERKIAWLAAKAGLTVRIEGDPRGYAAYIETPRSGLRNAWGPGWGI